MTFDEQNIIINSKDKLLFLIKNEYSWDGYSTDESSGPFIWLQFASPELSDDFDVVLVSVEKNGLALKYASFTLRENKLIVKTAFHQNYESLQYASETLRSDKEFVLDLLKLQTGHVMEYIIDEKLKYDHDIVSWTLKHDGMSLELIPKDMQTKDMVLNAVTENGLAIQYAKKRFLHDYDVLQTAMIQTPNAVKYVPSFLLMNREFLPKLLHLMSYYPNKILSTSLEPHRDFSLALVKNMPDIYPKLPDSFKLDWDFVKEHIKGDPYRILNVPQILFEVEEFVEQIIDRDNGELVMRNIPLPFLKERRIMRKFLLVDWNNQIFLFLNDLFAWCPASEHEIMPEVVKTIFDLLKRFGSRISKVYLPRISTGTCRFHYY